MGRDEVERLARRQDGVVRRDQLTAAGLTRDAVAAQIRAGRWVRRTSTVVSTFTGTPTRTQQLWIAVLHGGRGALVAGLSAAEMSGLRNWSRDEIEIHVSRHVGTPGSPVDAVRFIRNRRDLETLRAGRREPPRMALEPAVLLWASQQASRGTIEGVLAACVQQRLTEADALLQWLERVSPIPKGRLIREALTDIGGGAHSKAEIDLRRLCRGWRIATPHRQTKRRDADGRIRFTDAEWRTVDGRTLILEVDGAFHMDVESWEDDIARQRALSAQGVVIVRCTAREARDDSERVARDLIRLGAPRAA